jgi:hypothetical protein
VADDREQTAPRGITRRAALGLAAAAGGAVAAAGSVLGRERAAASSPQYPLAPQGTTLASTKLHGAPGALGYRKVVPGPGEPTLVRGDLLGGVTPQPGLSRTPLLALTQLTDMHLIDAQSPARVEFLDRYDDPGSPGA